jgi:hypothetical protein
MADHRLSMQAGIAQTVHVTVEHASRNSIIGVQVEQARAKLPLIALNSREKSHYQR